MRAAIRSGTELQALAFTTESSLNYRKQFRRKDYPEKDDD